MGTYLLGRKKEDNEIGCLFYVKEVDWNWLKTNTHLAHLINFKHIQTNWSGCDDLSRIEELKGFSRTGDIIILDKPIVIQGEDSDMGKTYEWRNEIDALLEVRSVKQEHEENGKEVKTMSVKELLEKQLQLLYERSERCSDDVLPLISEAMAKLAQTLALLG